MKFLFVLVALVGCHSQPTDTEETDSDMTVDTTDTDVAPVGCDNVMTFDGDSNGDADGIPENVMTQTFVNGLPIRYVQVQYFAGITVVNELTHDEDGRYLGYVTTSYPCVDCDFTSVEGVITDVYTREYLDAQNAIRETFESDTYPDYSRSDLYFFNEDDQIVRVESDSPLDGVVDGVYTYTYNEHGDMLSVTVESPDGLWPTQIHTWRYDSSNRMIRDEDDSQLTFWIYASNDRSYYMAKQWKPLHDYPDSVQYADLDENGRWTYMEYDGNADGVIDDAYYQSYDLAGRVILMQGDRNADEVIDSSESFTYDQGGHLLTDVADNAPYDGTPDDVQTWTYDAYGREIIWESNWPVDSIIDQRQTWTYDCAP